MPIILYSDKRPNEIPELVLCVHDLSSVIHVKKENTDATHTFLPCIEYNDNKYTPIDFFHVYSEE